MKKFIKCEFNSDLKNVIVSRGIISSFFMDEDIDITIVNEVKTIVSEAVTNAIIHGYKEKNGVVLLELQYEDKKLEVLVEDKGCGIENIEKAREPLYTTQNEKERAGLGFTIMEIFSDNMEVKSKVNEGTCVKLTKLIA